MAIPAFLISALKRFTFGVLVAASLYHLYLVIHPFTPFASLSIPILDLTQVQRATHVFLLVLAGSLLMVVKPSNNSEPPKVGIGLWFYVLLAAIPLWSFWALELPFLPAAVSTLIWIGAVLAVGVPPLARRSTLMCVSLIFAPF